MGKAVADRLRVFLVAVLALSSFACGESGSREVRPIEVLYNVSGPSGTQFRLLQTPRNECGNGAGIQASNADHRFGDRVFETPHLFILENAFQPMRAVFENLDLDPIRVDLFLGLNLQASTSDDIDPGECRTLGTDPLDTLNPGAGGRQVRVEVCSRLPGTPSNVPCGESPDANVAFFATIGDQTATNITSCSIRPVAETCRTPATLFLEQPQDRVSAVITKFSDQNPDAVLRAELYIDDALSDTDNSASEVVVSKDI